MKITLLSLNKPIEDHGELDLIETIVKPRYLGICLFSDDELISILSKSQIKIENNGVYIEDPDMHEKYHNLIPHLQINAIHEVVKSNVTIIKQAEMEVLYLACHPNNDESVESIKKQIENQKRRHAPVTKSAGRSEGYLKSHVSGQSI